MKAQCKDLVSCSEDRYFLNTKNGNIRWLNFPMSFLCKTERTLFHIVLLIFVCLHKMKGVSRNSLYLRLDRNEFEKSGLQNTRS